MRKALSSILFSGLIAALVVGPTGCATKGELSKVRAEAREANEMAKEALATAERAEKRTEEMVNRGYRKGMYK